MLRLIFICCISLCIFIWLCSDKWCRDSVQMSKPEWASQ